MKIYLLIIKFLQDGNKLLEKETEHVFSGLKFFTFIIYIYANLFIYKFGLSVCLSVWVSWCLFVCLYPINVKMAEPIGPKFFVGSRVTPGKVYGWSNFQKFASIKIRFLKILKIREIFCFYYLLTRRSPVYFIFTNEIKYRREAP